MARRLTQQVRCVSSIASISLYVSQDGRPSVRNREEEKFIAEVDCDRYCEEEEDERLIEICNQALQFYMPDRTRSEQVFLTQYYKEDNREVSQIAYVRFLNDVWTDIACQTLMKMPTPDLKGTETAKFEKIINALREIRVKAREKVASGYNIIHSTEILMNIGVRLLSSRSFIRSVVCYFAVATILSSRNTKNTSSEISTCVFHIFQISKDMKKDLPPETFQCMMEQIIPLIWEIISHFGSIQRYISHENEVDFEHGVSLYYLARMYHNCGQYEEDAAINERAIKKLRHGRETSWFYACCHNNAGVAHTKLKNYEKAKVFYERAIESYKLVTNWTSAKKRDDSIATTTRNLKRVERILQGDKHTHLK